ncbi:SMI1/KNR4 family protein [Moraxella sp.]|uniref:SMI1/KNR4 family protein n=1 Tax=Moraxella sp. TaxID=479 RepID=UPI0026DADD9F|nr:SMI1/KNR4 family protein [Moraxella sp.]MDO4894457.1 SMI1/KNR4 family protein [Moraxella sp.]
MKQLKILDDNGQADIQLIRDFEKEYNITLPNSYVELISKHNGLRLYNNRFDFINLDGLISSTDIYFLSFGDDFSENMADFQWCGDSYSYENLVLFGVTAYGDSICFDYRPDLSTNNPPVRLMRHEDTFINQYGQDKNIVFPIANSFDEFLDMLYEEVD